jgi:hypothetical protein
MVIKKEVFNLKFDLTIKQNDEETNFFITSKQLAAYLNDQFYNWEVAQQLIYLQGIYDIWSIDCFDSLFEDDDFLAYMFQLYGWNQII